MRSPAKNKKDQILDAALDLFSVDGYAAVSIRDICKAVGIKESSIYYHFKNKEDILRTVLLQAEQQAQVRKDNFNNELHVISIVEREKFIYAGIAYVEGYLLEGQIHKLIRMLTIENKNGSVAEYITTCSLPLRSNIIRMYLPI